MPHPADRFDMEVSASLFLLLIFSLPSLKISVGVGLFQLEWYFCLWVLAVMGRRPFWVTQFCQAEGSIGVESLL